MERFKQLVIGHFERILVGLILLVAFIGTYFIEEKSIILNFYYLPVLVAGYLLGQRMGLLTAILSILAVLLCVLFFPSAFGGANNFCIISLCFLRGLDFSSWRASWWEPCTN